MIPFQGSALDPQKAADLLKPWFGRAAGPIDKKRDGDVPIGQVAAADQESRGQPRREKRDAAHQDGKPKFNEPRIGMENSAATWNDRMIRMAGKPLAPSHAASDDRRKDLLALVAVNACSLAASLVILVPILWMIKHVTL